MNDNKTSTPKEQVDAFIREYHQALGLSEDEIADFIRGVSAIRCRAKARSRLAQVFIEKIVEYAAVGIVILLGMGLYHLGESIIMEVVAKGH